MRFFQSSMVQVEDAWLTNTPFKKKNGVPDTVPETSCITDQFEISPIIQKLNSTTATCILIHAGCKKTLS